MIGDLFPVPVTVPTLEADQFCQPGVRLAFDGANLHIASFRYAW